MYSLPSSSHARVDRGRLRRGQAAVELALVAPVLFAFVFGIFSFWLHYQKIATYTSASQTLAEWVARDGQYTPSMGIQIQDMLDQAIGVNSSEASLSIIVLDGQGGSLIDAIGRPPGASGDAGWGGEIAQGDILSGYFIQVDIWSYHTIGAPGLGLGAVFVPDGHAVMSSMWVSTAAP